MTWGASQGGGPTCGTRVEMLVDLTEPKSDVGRRPGRAGWKMSCVSGQGNALTLGPAAGVQLAGGHSRDAAITLGLQGGDEYHGVT